MAPRTKGPARNASPTRSQSDLPEEALPQVQLPEHEPDSDYDDATETPGLAQLQEQVRSLRADRQRDRDLLAQILAQVTQNNPRKETQPLSRTIERSTPDSSLSSPDQPFKQHSKKARDPPALSDGTDPTFTSWKILIQGKFRTNADHFQDEEAKMLYLFNCTTGDAQKHLEPRFDEDSQTRFVSAKEMLNHLESIYVNPNQVRDSRHEYNNLTMSPGQPFAEFQTRFLHLAGQAQIPSDSLRLDLYDKLTTQLQRGIAPNLHSLEHYADLSKSCLSLDTELKRIIARESQQRRQRTATIPIAPTTVIAPRLEKPLTGTPRAASVTPRFSQALEKPRQFTPADPATATCYNCHKLGHFASSCPEPQKGDLKEIEEGEPYNNQAEEDEDSGKEEP